MASALTSIPAESGRPWKWDVVVYDRPGWSGRFRGRARTVSPDGRRIYVRFEEVARATYFGDHFMGRHFDTCLVSHDGGRCWAPAIDPPPMDGVVLPDGSRLVVDHTIATQRGEALRAYLEEAGLPHLWHPDAFAWWDLAGPERRAELDRQGLYVRAVAQPHAFLAYLRDLSVGVYPPGSAAWTWRRLEGVPRMAHLSGWWRQRAVVLDGATVVGCATGRYAPDEAENRAFALRSPDGGRTWELRSIARATSAFGFNETFIFPMRDGRLLAMIRTTAPDNHLYRSVSADGGRTWSTPERTPIWGYPAHLLRLDSGAILCTYAHRRHPYGVRAALSYDDGVTWDVQAEKILRDEGAGAVGYPISVQLADGTIFTAYELGKPARAEVEERQRRQAAELDRPVERRGTVVDPERQPQSYVAGSRFTAEYVTPLGRRKIDA
ncbi:MAG: exo-alpha-sialidase [Chloroflexi bacterium]|nr:exo-alpha-sialidase [Chloroflexota bacterium]